MSTVCLGPAFGQDAAPRAGRGKNLPQDIEELLQRQSSRNAGPEYFERASRDVKSAFRDVVKSPAKSTVRVLGDGQWISLGTIVSPEGFILTKASELRGKLECILNDKRRLEAQCIGVEKKHDLAMLKVDAVNLPAIEWSDRMPEVGSWVVTPGQEKDKVPAAIGVVSVAPRKIPAPRAVLGVLIEPDERGSRIERMIEGGPAATAGLRSKDVITHLDDARIENRDLLIKNISARLPGDKVKVTFVRGEERQEITITLGKVPQQAHEERMDFQDNLGGPLSDRRSGFPVAVQHDSVLQPRECGGPLVDLDGKAIGVNIARGGRVASFAIPSSAVLPMLAELKSGRLAPGPTMDERHRELTQQYERLKNAVADWAKKFEDLQAALRRASESLATAEKAVQARPDSTTQLAVQQARQLKATQEQESAKIKAALEKATNDLKRVETEKFTFEKTSR